MTHDDGGLVGKGGFMQVRFGLGIHGIELMAALYKMSITFAKVLEFSGLDLSDTALGSQGIKDVDIHQMDFLHAEGLSGAIDFPHIGPLLKAV